MKAAYWHSRSFVQCIAYHNQQVLDFQPDYNYICRAELVNRAKVMQRRCFRARTVQNYLFNLH